MVRLSNEKISKIKNLSLEGMSLREIQKRTRLPLSTIQYHSPKRKKGRIKIVKIPKSNFTIGEIMGAFAGDGYAHTIISGRTHNHFVRFFLSYDKDQAYAKYLFNLLRKMNLNPHIYNTKYKGKYSKIEVRVSSIKFKEFISNYLKWRDKKKYTVSLREGINYYNKDFLRGFIRGLMDTDGFVEVYNVAFGVVSKKLALNFRDILNEFKVECSFKVRKDKRENRKDLYLCRVPRRNLDRFNDLFSFSNPRKLNSLMNILNGAARI